MNYYRAYITGTLTTCSALHIGTGELVEDDNPSIAIASASEAEQQTHCFNSLLRDSKGLPYIPAATLRGYLRSLIQPKAVNERLFGHNMLFIDPETEEELTCSMGMVRVYDARCKQPPTIPKLSRTSIEPVTQTAAQHQLSTHEIVPCGTSFEVVIELEATLQNLLPETDILALLQALQTFSAEQQGQLGKGKSTGQGLMYWQQGEVKVLSQTDFSAWVNQPNLTALKTKFTPLTLNTATTAQSAWTVIPFELLADAPLLINDPHDAEVQRKRHASAGLEGDQTAELPDLAFSKLGEGVAYIPASTLKGWCRAHCRRILLTLVQTPDHSEVDRLLALVFGSTHQQGILRFFDATVRYSSEDEHRQTFNAIDRFTGGVKDTALYNVKALWAKEAFTVQVSYQASAVQDWMKLLGLWLWRDAVEGDLVVGWGKSKGFGRLRVQATTHWQDYCNEHAAVLGNWERDLHAILGLASQGVRV